MRFSLLARFRKKRFQGFPNGVLQLPMQQIRTFKNCWLLAHSLGTTELQRASESISSIGGFYFSVSTGLLTRAQSDPALRIRRAETCHPPGRGSGTPITTCGY